MKKIFLIVMISLFSLNITGCRDNDADKVSKKIDQILQKKESETENKKSGNETARYFQEKHEQEEENLTHNEAQKNAPPIKSMDYNISVQKDEMDKLKNIAGDYRWTENEVREAVIILKNCGIDFSKIERIESHPTVSNGYEIYLRKNENEETALHSWGAIVCIKMNGAKPSSKNSEDEKRKISEVYAELDTVEDNKYNVVYKQFYCLYVSYGNTEKIVGNCDDLFMSHTVYRKIADQLNNFVDSRNGRILSAAEIAKIHFKWHYDFQNRKIYYSVEEEIQLPSEIYGEDFEEYIMSGNFNYKGDLIGSINVEKKK